MTRATPLLAMLGLGLIPGRAFAEDCVQAVTSGQLLAQIEVVERGWTSRDTQAVTQGATDVVLSLDCVRAPLSPQLTARLHRALGLSRIVQGDREAAAAAFTSARLTDPHLGMNSTLTPDGSPVWRLYHRPSTPLPGIPLPAPRRGQLLIDGSPSDTRATDRPLVLQHLATDGQVRGTWWLDVAQSLPTEPWADPHRPARHGLRAAGLGTVVAGLGLLGGAALTARAHQDTTQDRDSDRLAKLRDQSRGLTVAGGALTGLGAGAVAVSWSGRLR